MCIDWLLGFYQPETSKNEAKGPLSMIEFCSPSLYDNPMLPLVVHIIRAVLPIARVGQVFLKVDLWFVAAGHVTILIDLTAPSIYVTSIGYGFITKSCLCKIFRTLKDCSKNKKGN